MIVGLDSLRILATLLVVWQHAASVLDAYAVTQWRLISPGQAGVAIFCAIAGFLAFRTPLDNRREWLKRRLLRLFPAYWLVTVPAFLIALVVPTKAVSWPLFISQMLGLGYFTHGMELINVVSWFVSLILLCYALSLFAARLGKPGLVWLAVAALALFLFLSRTEVMLSRHVLAYALGALLALGLPAVAAGAMAALLILAGVFFDPQCFYAGFALVLLMLARSGWVTEPGWARVGARFSYEFFLVHGICLVGAVQVFGKSLLAIALALVAACLAAVVVERVQGRLAARLAGCCGGAK